MKNAFRLLLTGLVVLWGCTAQELPHLDETQNNPENTNQEEPQSDALDFRVQVEGKDYRPVDESDSGCIIFVPWEADLKNLVAVFNDNGSTLTVAGVTQESGVTTNNFSSYKNGVNYKIKTPDGKTTDFNVKVLGTRLPVVVVNTDSPRAITSKTTWRAAQISIMGTDWKLYQLGKTEIRGRGNWTWEKYPKKPYAIKLENSQKVLGMPAHKRWVLLAQYRGFIGNPLMFEATRRAPGLGWAPRGEFVELVLNGKFQGLYYLCEQIKIDKDRVNIAKLKAADTKYPAVSGGYLLEYDELYDEPHKFKSAGFNLPVQIKSPNDTLPDEQFNYIKTFINEMEAE
ncbi:MAG: CotH kinase family protein, partial [Bacteroidales bacterium]|nr:CotH kinase family protein [Bacteroidales bacterium]